MAVTPVSNDDEQRVRYPFVRITDLILNVVELTVAGTAKVNAPGGLDDPVADIPVDTTSVGWEDLGIGLFTRIVGSSVKKYEGNTRRGNTLTLVRINGIRPGDTGRTAEIMPTIADNDDVTVYRVIIPTTVRSRIDPNDGTFYKKWDVAYTDQTIFPQPVANLETNQWALVDSITGKATFTLPLSGSNDSFSWNGNPLDFEWVLESGVALTGGALTDPVIEVEADPGQYLITCVVTDSITGKLQSGARWIFAVDNDTYKAFSQRYSITEITLDTSDRTGWKFQFVVEGNPDEMPTEDDFLYIGAPVLFSYKWQYRPSETEAWEDLDDPDGQRHFNGFITGFSEVTTTGDGVARIVIDVEGIAYYHARMPLATQTLTESTAPDNWTKMDVDLNNVAYGTYYLLDDHASAPNRMCGFYDDDDFDTFRRASFKVNAGDMLSGLQSQTALVAGGNIGSTPDGSMRLRRNLSYELAAYRAALSNRYTYTPTDIQSPDESTPAQISYSLQPLMQYADCDGGGFVWAAAGATTAFKGRFGYLAPTQGTQRATLSDFVETSQANILAKVGNYMAYVNRGLSDFGWRQKFDLIEPVRLEPVALDVSLAAYWPLGVMPERAVPLQVTREWDLSVPGTPPTVDITFEPETEGQPATLFEPDTIGTGYTPNVWCYYWDLTTGESGWAAAVDGAGDLNTVYSASNGYTGFGGSAGDTVVIKRQINVTFTLTMAEFEYSEDLAGIDELLRVNYNTFTAGNNIGSADAGNAGWNTVFSGSYLFVSGGFLLIITDRNDGGIQRMVPPKYLTGVRLRGTGTNPFGANNC